MSKIGGYTEAELLAAEWSKQRKKQSEIERTSDENKGKHAKQPRFADTNKQSSREQYSCRNSTRYDRDHWRKSTRSRSRSRSIPRSRSHSPVGLYEQHSRTDRTHHKEPSIDEFGRTVEPGRVIAKAREDRPVRSMSRSRSRSIDRQRKRIQGSWRHDKFDSRESSPVRERREMPRDYRPPSPTWVSKAGGVAIMRPKRDL